MAHVLITGYFGSGNLGDEAVLTSIIDDLRRADPSTQVKVVSGNTEETTARYDVKAVPRGQREQLVTAISNADLLVIAGGLYHDYEELRLKDVFSSDWGLAYYFLPLAAQLMDKRTMMYGMGIGPLPYQTGQRVVGLIAQGTDVITVRDELTRQTLLSLEVPPEKVIVTADPAFCLQADVNSSGHLIESFGLKPKEWIAACLREWPKPGPNRIWERQLAESLDSLVDLTHRSIVFVSFQSTNEWDDNALAYRIMSQMNNAERCHVLAESCSPSELAGLLADASLVVAMRLHAIIFAAKAGVPIIALNYDPKVRAAMSQLGIEEQSLEIEAFSTEVLLQQAQNLLGNNGLADRLRQGSESLRHSALSNAVYAQKLVNLTPSGIGRSPSHSSKVLSLLLDAIADLRAENELYMTMFAEVSATLETRSHMRGFLRYLAKRIWLRVSRQQS